MAVVEMAGLTMVGPKDEVLAVAVKLLAKGCFEPLSVDSVIGDREIRSKISTSEGNPWDELLGKMENVWKRAKQQLPEPVMEQGRDSLPFEDFKKRVESIAGKLEIWQQRASELSVEREKLEAAKVYAEALASSDTDVSVALKTEILRIFAGSLSEDNFERLKEASLEVPLLPVLLKKTGDTCWIVVITVSGYLEGAEKLMESVFFQNFPLEDLAEHAGPDWKESLDRKIDNHSRAILKLNEAVEGYVEKNRKRLEELYARIYCMKRVYDICRKRGEVSGLYLVSGWLPAREMPEIRAMIEEKAPGTVILSETASMKNGSGKIPVFLSNLPFVRYFQDVVALYSMPAYGEKDPSLFVAITFCIFFGFMFGDIAHGLILSGAALVMEKRGILSRSFGSVLGLAGLSSVIFGFLYGSIFGNEHIIKGIWLSPLEDINSLIVYAIILGITVISAGMMINISICYGKKDWGKALFDVQGLAGLFLYWFAVILAWSFLSAKDLPISPWILVTVTLLLVMVIFFSDVLSGAIFKNSQSRKSPVVHVFQVLHNLLSFLSNTVSFVRLAAFALNHVGLSLAVLMLSEMVTGLPGGDILSWVILVTGHLVIISLEGLIVFIQTLRLEYYEFFSKFYTGGGRAFSPVRWK